MCSMGAAGRGSPSSHPCPSPIPPGQQGPWLRAGRGKRGLHPGVRLGAASGCRRGGGAGRQGERRPETDGQAGREETAAGGRGEVYSRRHLSRARRGSRPEPATARPARLGHAPRRCRPGLVTAGRRPRVPTQASAAAALTSVSGVRTERGRLPPAHLSLPASLPLSRVREER